MDTVLVAQLIKVVFFKIYSSESSKY